MNRPAILDAVPAFDEPLPFVAPTAPPLEKVVARLAPSYERGVLTNGPIVREFEEAVAARIGAQAIAVSSCTAGLMLTLRALDLSGSVVLPSFTFSASAHAVVWNGLGPRFVECDPATFQVDPRHVAECVRSADAVLATHVFGATCDVEALAETASGAGVPLVFDAAHALGAYHRDRAAGTFGTAEVFSLSPTKVVVAGEGGIVTTNDGALADAVRIGRDYGNPGNYDTQFVGLNARMSELHAAVALESLAGLDGRLARRAAIVDRYRQGLVSIPGIRSQRVGPDDRSTYKDFTIAVDEIEFGLPRDLVVAALRADGIDTRCYFSPPVHRQRAYHDVVSAALPVTDLVAGRVISLPIYGSLGDDDVDRIVDVLEALHRHAGEIRATAAA